MVSRTKRACSKVTRRVGSSIEIRETFSSLRMKLGHLSSSSRQTWRRCLMKSRKRIEPVLSMKAPQQLESAAMKTLPPLKRNLQTCSLYMLPVVTQNKSAAYSSRQECHMLSVLTRTKQSSIRRLSSSPRFSTTKSLMSIWTSVMHISSPRRKSRRSLESFRPTRSCFWRTKILMAKPALNRMTHDFRRYKEILSK